MSQDPKTINPDDSQAPKKSPVSDSPWDDDLPPEVDNKQMIVGDLEKTKSADDASPVPFNIPKDVIEQKDKEKIPAASVVKQPEAVPSSAKPKEGISALIKPADTTPPVPVKSSPTFQKPMVVTQNEASTAGPTIIHNDSKSMSADIQPGAVKQPAPNAPLPLANVNPPAPQQNQGIKSGLLARIGSFKAKKSETSSMPSSLQERMAHNTPAPSGNKKNLLIVVGIVLLLVAGIVLTEAGIASFGLEKVYGAVGLEGLWGGLPKNPEKAIMMATAKVSRTPEFKVEGTVEATVDKSVNSNIFSPLLSAISIPFALRDTNGLSGAAALLTEYDPYADSTDITDGSTDTGDMSDYSETDTEVPLSEPDYSDVTADPVTDPDTDSGTDVTSTDATNTDSAQDSSISYSPEATTTKEISADVSLLSSSSASSADITIKRIVGTENKISLIAQKNDLLVKSDEKIKFSDKAEKNKWLDFDLTKTSEENPVLDFTKIKSDQGLSLEGSRMSNEVVGSKRCYRYNISNLEIGDSLSYLGIDSSMVEKISGDIWIGISDKLIKKISLNIVPASSSAVQSMDIKLDFKDFGVQNDISVPSTAERISVSKVDISTAAEDEELEDLSTDIKRDEKRRSDLEKIRTSLEKFKTANGRYPISSQLDKSNSAASILKSSLVPTYLDTMPSDPNSTSGWFYGYTSTDGIKYVLSCQIENPADTKSTVVNGTRLYWVKN